jgi:hypothetical protein
MQPVHLSGTMCSAFVTASPLSTAVTDRMERGFGSAMLD